MRRTRLAVGALLVTATVLLAIGVTGALAATESASEADPTDFTDSTYAQENGTETGMNDSMTGTETGMGDSMTGTETGMNDSMTETEMGDSMTETETGMTDSGMNDSQMTETGMTEAGMDGEMTDATDESTAFGPGFGVPAFLAALVIGTLALGYARKR